MNLLANRNAALWACVCLISALSFAHGNEPTIEIDLDLTPPLSKLSDLYHKLQRGAQTLLHTPFSVKTRRPSPSIPGPIPETVLFSKTQSKSVAAAADTPTVTVERTVQHEDASASASEVRPNYVTIASASSSHEWHKGPPPGWGWGSRPPPPRPPHSHLPLHHHHDHDLHHHPHHHGPPSSPYVSRPPPPKQYVSYGPPPSPPHARGPPPSHYGPPKTTTTYVTKTVGGWAPPSRPSGWGWPKPGPPTKTVYIESGPGHHSSAEGWDWDESPPSAPYGSELGLGYGPVSGWPKEEPVSKEEGWGWKKKCDILTEAPFEIELKNRTVIPEGSRITDGYGNEASIDDLPQNFIPPPPSTVTIGLRTLVPPGFTPVRVERHDITVGPDGTPNMNKEVSHGAKGIDIINTSGRPRINHFQITTGVSISPNFSAPLNGASDSRFIRALEERNRAIREAPAHPFTTQLETLLQVFNEIDSIETRQREAEEARRGQQRQAAANNNGWTDKGQGQEQGQGFGDDGRFSAPLLVTLVQRFSIPEPNSSEPSILDSAFNFGPQANRIVFGDLDQITDGWKDGLAAPKEPLDLTRLGNTVDEIEDTLGEWVRGYIKNMRDGSAFAYNSAEDLAYGNLFEQYQFFITPPGECVQPVDPGLGAAPQSTVCGSGNFKMRAAPRCFVGCNGRK